MNRNERITALPKKRRSSCAGFSMVEMLLVLAALAILFGAIYSGFERLNRSYTAENVKAGTQQSARIGVEMMVQDIRLAGLNPLGTAGAGIVANPTAGRLQFTADVNFDGDTDDPFENITYDLSGTTLRQTNLNLDPNPVTLLQNVAGLAFTYFDEAGNLIPETDLAARRLDIRSVGITLTVDRPAGYRQTVSRTYSTQVRCRNL
jgi:type IV pilus assembly protein PilW